METLTMASLAAGTSACTMARTVREPGHKRQPNVLFIASDDLRPMLACYGVPFIHTPNLDRLAARGVAFDHAYCQVALCGPSRASLLTGLRPDSTHIFDNSTHFRVHHPDVETLPQHFKAHGYHTQAVGKIFHSCFERAYVGRSLDDPPSWSTTPYFPSPQYYHTPEGMRAAREVFARAPQCRREGTGVCLHNRLQPVVPDADRSDSALNQWTDHFIQGPISEAPDIPDDVPYDGQVAAKAVEFLRNSPRQPFFLAVGFMKPHTPYVAPKKYWDLYDPEQLPVAPNPHAPLGMPSLALMPEHDHGYYLGVDMKGPVDEGLARRLTHGYAACVTYMDALLGRVIEALEGRGLMDDTIIVFWGDNGYHLGENSRWGKQTCFETGTRCPLIIAAPDSRASGSVCRRPVELLGIYPTLCELAGLPVPDHAQGLSLSPLLHDPLREWDGVAVSQFPNPVRLSRPEVKAEPGDCMGYSLRTERHRLTVWSRVLSPHEEVGVELYDYQVDPLETANLALRPEYGPVVADMRRKLEEYHARGR